MKTAGLEKANEYAEKLLSTPRSRISVTLRQSKRAVTLLHKRKSLTRCKINMPGMQAAFFMAKALGIKIPPLGGSVDAHVSSGVLWRAISISCLDFRKQESYVLLERLLLEAEMMLESKIDSA